MGQTFSYLFMNNINFINKKEQSKEKYAMRAITSAYYLGTDGLVGWCYFSSLLLIKKNPRNANLLCPYQLKKFLLLIMAALKIPKITQWGHNIQTGGEQKQGWITKISLCYFRSSGPWVAFTY